MTSSAEIILLSSTSGLDIDDCARRLCSANPPSQSYGPVKLEKFHLGELNSIIEQTKITTHKNSTIIDALGSSFSELVTLSNNSWIKMLDEVQNRPDKKIQFSVATFHPVIYHPLTREFVEPYLAGKIANLTNEYKEKNGTSIKFIVSIHDDIYDVYRRLMRPGRLFDPHRRKGRQPLDDISDLRLLLDWRDRELSAARALASSIGAKHLLFHRKGRLKALGQIVFKNKPCVYFSHPIGQPRRDITNRKDKLKCKTPDPLRGQQLIDSIQSFANHLALFAPIIEPTAIDELRLNTKRLAHLTEHDIRQAILPPLMRRWPIGEAERLGGDNIDLNSENEIELLPVCKESVDAFHDNTKDKSLKWLRSSVELLKQEILRQIGVRDRMLVSQADIVVVFRPYSLPDSPEPTGGVDAEIEAAKFKQCQKHRKTCLIVIHPQKDELRRRGNVFDKIWESEITKFYDKSNAALNKFKELCRRLIVGPHSPLNSSELHSKLSDIFQNSAFSAPPMVRETAMPSGSLRQDQTARQGFIAALSGGKNLLKSTLALAAEENPESVTLIDASEFTKELIDIVSKALGNETDEV